MFEDYKKIDFDFDGVRLPKFTMPSDDMERLGLTPETSHEDMLRTLCRDGYKRKVLPYEGKRARAKEYIARVESEMAVLSKTKFIPYILLVWDVMNFTHKNGIPVGKGRGSGAGSLVNYLLGVTDIDPIEHGLFFERFVSESRAKCTEVDGVTYYEGSLLPDLDLDIGHEKRELVIAYLQNKYKDRCSRVSAISTLQTKALIKEIGKIVGGYTEDYMNEISDSIPKLYGNVLNIDTSIEQSEKFRNFAEKNPYIIELARKLYECPKNFSVHASAYLLTYEPLNDLVPCQLDNEGNLMSTYDKDIVEAFALKLDLLGLKCVTIVENVCERVGIKLDDIDYNSYDEIYSYLQDLGTPYGLFQISGGAVVKGLKKMKPNNLNDLSNVIAIVRPGAMDFIEDYVNHTYPVEDKKILDILEETHGICIYQESLIRIGKEVFGLTADQAEMLRRAAAKKKKDEVDKWLKIVEAQAVKLKVPKETKDYYLKVLEDSAGYGFNKCIHPDEYVTYENGKQVKLKDVQVGDKILAFDTKTAKDHFVTIKKIYKNNVEVAEFTFSDKAKVRCSYDHKFLCDDLEMRTIKDIAIHKYALCNRPKSVVVSGSALGKCDTIDIEVDHEDHNFYVNGLITSNSHSYSYAVLAAATCYCKFKYPREFFLESIRVNGKDDIPFVERELPYFGIKLLHPDIIKSEQDFTIEGDNIRYGLSGIKGLSDSSLLKIGDFINKKTANKFQVFEAAKQSKVTIGVVSKIITAGALNSLGDNRPKLVLEAKIWNELSDREKAYCLENGYKTNYDLIDLLKSYLTWLDGGGKPFKESRLQTIRRDCAKYFEDYARDSKYSKLAAYLHEKDLLGYSYSYTIKQVFEQDNPRLKNISHITTLANGANLECVAEVIEVKKAVSQKNGKNYIRMTCADESGAFGFMLWGDNCDKFLRKFKVPEEGDLMYIIGRMGDDTVWINTMEKQEIGQ